MHSTMARRAVLHLRGAGQEDHIAHDYPVVVSTVINLSSLDLSSRSQRSTGVRGSIDLQELLSDRDL